jgi:hypothetical protein
MRARLSGGIVPVAISKGSPSLLSDLHVCLHLSFNLLFQ